MRLRDLKKPIMSLSYDEAIDLIKERRSSRFKSKKRPKSVRKKIDKKKNLISLLEGLSREELLKLKEDLNGNKED